MLTDQMLLQQLPLVLDGTNIDFLGPRYEGKVRDNYTRGDTRVLVTTDRLSCFDRVVTTVPFKGQVLTALALHWFKLSEGIVCNHVLDNPDPNVIVGKNCEVLPVEVVVRSYLTGSAWRDYEAGNAVSGVRLPSGMKASQKLPQPIITPSTKAEKGSHDEPISEEEIVTKGIVAPKLWEEIRAAALGLFELGQRKSAEQGLILVDTKYEFGLHHGKLTLVDEIHTLDSSRYWVAESYQQRFEAGESPQMLDKEPTRQWLLSQGFKGDGSIPTFTNKHRCEIARHYLDSFKLITGSELVAEVGSVAERVEKNLREKLG